MEFVHQLNAPIPPFSFDGHPLHGVHRVVKDPLSPGPYLQAVVLVRFQQFQTVELELFPHGVHFIHDVLELFRSVKVPEKVLRGSDLRRPTPGETLPPSDEGEVALNRSSHGVVIGLPGHQVLGVQIPFMGENNALPSPGLDGIRQRLASLLQRLRQCLNFLGQVVDGSHFFNALNGVTSLLELRGQVGIKGLYQLDCRKPNSLFGGVKCLPLFEALKCLEQRKRPQVGHSVAVAFESLCAGLYELALPIFICFDGGEVADDFVQSLRGVKETVKRYNGRQA